MSWSQQYQSRFLNVDPAVPSFQLNRSVFTDPEVHREEKEKLLYKSWLYFAHDSEIPHVNDYVVRKIVDKTVIFVRDRHEKVHAFLNTCTHRGTMLCPENKGNQKTFGCPYHGWVFRNSGELMATNSSDGMYSDSFNADGRYNLFPVPRLENRGGFYFVNFDPNAQSLDDFLGDAADRIDMLSQHAAGGLEVIGCQEYIMHCNYKMMCENSIDNYHLMPTHQSFFNYQKSMVEGLPPQQLTSQTYSLTNGHGTTENDMYVGRPVAQWLPVWGETAKQQIEEKKAEMIERLGPERGRKIAETNRLMVIFPSTVMNDQQTIHIRSVMPISQNETVVRAWALAAVDDTPELRELRLSSALTFIGPGGFAHPDDMEMLERAQSGYEVGGVEWNDYSNGFLPEESTLQDVDLRWGTELHLRAYWTQYDRLMNAVPD